MNALRTFFDLEANRIVLDFGHGLIFFLMGFGVLLKSKRWSNLTLAKSLPSLGLFGILNAMGDWGLVFIPIQRPVFSEELIGVLWVLDIALVSFSYLMLLHFGARLLADTRPHLDWFPRILPAAYGVWFAALMAALMSGTVDPIHDLTSLLPFEIAYRYGFAFTGSLLAAWALSLQREELRRLNLESAIRPTLWVAYSFVLHAFAAGLLVPEAGFFPASVVNDREFFALTGIPVRLFTGISGAITGIFILINMDVFDVEFNRRIEEARRLRAVVEERTRIARDLHDGIIQTLYALGLAMEGVLFELGDAFPKVKEEIKGIMASLDRAIKDVRGYIVRLKTPDSNASLDEQLRLFLQQLQRESRVRLRLKVEPVEADLLSADAIQDVLLVVREAVSNANRHARASAISISLVRDEKGISLSVVDDGVGFDPESAPKGSGGEHLGLENMQKRAEALGGHLSIHSEPGHGTEVLLRIPLQPQG